MRKNEEVDKELEEAINKGEIKITKSITNTIINGDSYKSVKQMFKVLDEFNRRSKK